MIYSLFLLCSTLTLSVWACVLGCHCPRLKTWICGRSPLDIVRGGSRGHGGSSEHCFVSLRVSCLSQVRHSLDINVSRLSIHVVASHSMFFGGRDKKSFSMSPRMWSVLEVPFYNSGMSDLVYLELLAKSNVLFGFCNCGYLCHVCCLRVGQLNDFSQECNFIT